MQIETRRRVLRGLLGAVLVGGMSLAGSADAQEALQVGGVYGAQWGAGAINLSLQQTGVWVNGIYTGGNGVQPGAMAGRLTGNTLVGRWTDANSSGGFTLVFTPDGRAFAGSWGRSVASNTDGGPWTGRRR